MNAREFVIAKQIDNDMEYSGKIFGISCWVCFDNNKNIHDINLRPEIPVLNMIFKIFIISVMLINCIKIKIFTQSEVELYVSETVVMNDHDCPDKSSFST